MIEGRANVSKHKFFLQFKFQRSATNLSTYRYKFIIISGTTGLSSLPDGDQILSVYNNRTSIVVLFGEKLCVRWDPSTECH